MASSEASTSDGNQISWYRDKALSMMCVFEKKDQLIFHEWLNRFEYVADIIHVPKDKMVEFFNIMVNDDLHKFVKQQDPNFNLHELSYDGIINNYFNICVGKNYNLVRLCFKHRNQYENEPIKYYANYLRMLLKKCEYKRKNSDEQVYEQFLNGLREDVIKNYLSRIHYETLDEMIAKAIEFEKLHLETYYRDHALLKIDTYNKEKGGEFYVWLNKFEYVADIIDVPDTKMIKFFNNMVNIDTQVFVEQAFPIVNFFNFSYDKIINYYFQYFYPNVVETHTLRLFCRKQYEREVIEKYAQHLRNLLNKCTCTTDHEKKLFKHFINGLREEEIKNHLRKTNCESFNEMVTSAIEFAKVNLITYYRDRALLKIDTYNERKEGLFYVWLNKFEYVAYTIDVPESKMGKLFIEMVDDDDSQSVMQAYPSVNFNKLTYDKKIEYYLKFHTPNEKNVHRNCFMSRCQYEQELTKTYVHFFRRYYKKSEYRRSNYINLHARFLQGLRENDTKNYLEKFPNVTFDRFVTIAIEFEKANLLTHYRDQALLMINIYSPRKEGSFSDWFNRFESVADKIEIPDSKRSQLFFEMIDNNVNQNVKQAFTSVKISDLPYNQIMQHYISYFTLSFEEDCNISQCLFQV